MAQFLVTGGAGFIGSHLSEELVRRGHRVRVADSLVTGKRSNLDHVPEAEFLEGDLAELPFARRAVDGVDYVLHQAAIPSVPRSVKDPLTSHRASVDGTLNVLVAARDVAVKRLVFAGSSSEYGNSPTLPKREDMPSDPLSPYALQKVIGEQYLQLFTRLYGLETVSIRYFNVFDGVLRACEAPSVSGEVINVATGGRISLNQLFETMKRLVGGTVEPTYVEPRPGDVRDSQADISKARRLLGYAPTVSFEDGLNRTIEWYRTAAAAGAAR